MQENISRGGKPNRLTPEGYWKAAGTPTLIYSNNEIIGGKRTMIFYRGRAPTGRKTEWKMIEYKAILGQPPPTATMSDVQLRHEFIRRRGLTADSTGRPYVRPSCHCCPSSCRAAISTPANCTRNHSGAVIFLPSAGCPRIRRRFIIFAE
ncbi:PREDICTED: NAC domain-containing protein 90-like [Ipomoea nil]|uniref:NAC domain-containing protein 90-like n=1 Tax=Ipomoea nil TaxID=35883 RepID=UPI0009016135|nr:PREDICTED: NAC domain-containing protein 90-like [Ipomoea nil]